MFDQEKVDKRKHITYQESITPCEGCDFPLSHRHHMLEFSKYGENDSIIYVCPTCHYILHVGTSALLNKSQHSYRLWNHLLKTLGDSHHRIMWVKNKVKETKEKELYEQVGKYL